jgi:1-pyrroline-5-carboxylate dehydrogenase
MSGVFRVPEPRNEPIESYAPGTVARKRLQAALAEMAKEVVTVPLTIGGERVETHDTDDIVMPHDHQRVIGKWHRATRALVDDAITAAEEARAAWTDMSFDARAAIFLKAADLLAGPWRDRMNAATMLGQSKTCHQAEIDAACELADFWRFNAAYAERIAAEQPLSPPGAWNRVEYRPLDGFVFAVTPFNFTSIAGNLPTAPALMGNTVVWKPASTQMRSAFVILQILEEAGLPAGVVNMVMGQSSMIGETVLDSPFLGGIHFTGGTSTFNHLFATVGRNIGKYRQYPRLVGETGGKDFIFAHRTADADELVTAIIRGGYEYQGQKCSAASRVYVPKSMWPAVRKKLVEQVDGLRVGDVQDFGNFMGAVIDAKAFATISSYIGLAKTGDTAKILSGGTCDDSKGWFIRPTLVETSDPRHRLMKEEIFGPVVTVFPYDDAREDEALRLCDEATPYALTGAVFAKDRAAIEKISRALRFAAGNFYINDKPTGAVVGQQPFGGGRGSGTNDKAGSPMNLLRWASARAIKETFVPARDHRYPFMSSD